MCVKHFYNEAHGTMEIILRTSDPEGRTHAIGINAGMKDGLPIVTKWCGTIDVDANGIVTGLEVDVLDPSFYYAKEVTYGERMAMVVGDEDFLERWDGADTFSPTTCGSVFVMYADNILVAVLILQ